MLAIDILLASAVENRRRWRPKGPTSSPPKDDVALRCGGAGRGVTTLRERTSSRTLSVKDAIMTSITVTQARANLFKLLDQTAQSHEPIQITGRRQNGVLLSEDDFRAMQETVYLLSVPGMRASLRKARKAPLKAYTKDRPW